VEAVGVGPEGVRVQLPPTRPHIALPALTQLPQLRVPVGHNGLWLNGLSISLFFADFSNIDDDIASVRQEIACVTQRLLLLNY
jgi:hypothetical protein